MPKICYVDKTFRAGSLDIIAKAEQILAEYERQGFTLTLRQLYYQFVSRGYIPNRDSEYKRLGSVISDARLAGLIDWNSIIDRTRAVRSLSSWKHPRDVIKSAGHSFHIDRWATQEYQPEVWIEKDALVGVIEGVCQRLDVPYFSCRGYTSQSEIWSAGRRMGRHLDLGKRVVVFHLGDHDPSGIDMTRDITERVAMFAEASVEVDRLALHMHQIEQYNPPPNPAKESDSRFVEYQNIYGDESWELDALEPSVIEDLIWNAVNNIRDMDEWERVEERENEAKKAIYEVAERWDKIVKEL